MEYIEQYIQELSQSLEEINYIKFLLNLLVAAGLSSLLGVFYVRFGNAISNRRRFARNFLPLAMTTMVIIFIVKSSVALSLGLVGALSIVRFRSAIKDPEELTYLFFTIAVGLAAGADEILIAICATAFIMGVLFLQSVFRKGTVFKSSDNMHLNLSSSNKDLAGITKVLSDSFSFVELKRVDESDDRMDLSYVIAAKDIAEIEAARNKLQEIAPDIHISFVEQRHIAV
ncbi:MAG TPA: DUF4956 domain-containing protein [Bacteroidetes bacterium]|nr:DUF4956 domain-containing protein [Bacteroidota bacterium]